VRLRQLEVEAQESRESFHAMLEEVEATNEELQASNEELIASNEELQSTNEELQSVNEELHSVNAEYNQKIRELADAEADLRNLIANSVDGVVFVDADRNIRLFTPGACALLNLLPHDVGRPLAHITSRLPDDDLHETIDRVSADPTPIEKTVRTRDDRYVLRRVLPYRGSEAGHEGFVITFQDVTAREAIRRNEREHLELLQAMIGGSRSQVAVLDRNGTIVAANQAWSQFWRDNGGREPGAWLGRSYLDALRADPTATDALGMIEDVLAGRRPSADLDYPCHSSTEERWFWMNVTALPPPRCGALVTHTDITSRHQQATVAQRVQEAARLESLGLLAGGVAHDFNNILTGVMVNLAIVQSVAAGDPTATAALADISEASARAAELCRQMLAYAGRTRLVTQRTSLAALVRECQALIRASLRGAHLELELTPGVADVEVDPASIQQVLMNMVLNGVEALPDGRGTVWIGTGPGQPRTSRGETEVVPPGVQAGDFVELTVRDDGCGMDSATLRRIFEPFFTTKFTGRGLGLAATQGIVRAHHGALYVRTSPGVGTTFRVVLPAATGPANDLPAPDPLTPLPAAAPANVLVIDDEELLRRSLSRVLALHGHQVEVADSGQAGLDLVRAAPERFQLVILDLTMPGLDGVATLAALRELAPTLPVVIASGYAEARVAERFASHRPDGFLQKPIAAPTLTALLARVLPPAP